MPKYCHPQRFTPNGYLVYYPTVVSTLLPYENHCYCDPGYLLVDCTGSAQVQVQVQADFMFVVTITCDAHNIQCYNKRPY